MSADITRYTVYNNIIRLKQTLNKSKVGSTYVKDYRKRF